MFVEAVEAFVGAVKIYEERKTIADTVSRWLNVLLHGTTRVVVFGAGGVGKSTLGAFLSGKLDTDAAKGAYEQTLRIEPIKVAGRTPALLSVAPGQPEFRDRQWPDLYRELSLGKASHVINVVSWGYHTSGIERAKHRAYKLGMSDDEFRAAYLEDSRKEEVSVLRELVPHLNASNGPLTMVTLVTKQDLWWDRRNETEQHYLSGEYNNLIEDIRGIKGKANFEHCYLSCALIEQNLLMPDGFQIASTVAGYDDPLRVANLSKVAFSIEQMLKQ